MSQIDVVTLALAKKYTDKSILGTAGALVGASAYQIAVNNGFVGSEADWLNSLKGDVGDAGESPEFRTVGNVLQYRFATATPNVWTDLYTFVPLTYVHHQTLPSTVWNIQHNLGGQPVTALTVNATGEQIVGELDAPLSTGNLIVIRFSEALTGTAYIKL